MPTIATNILIEEAESLDPRGRWLVLGGEAALANELATFADFVAWRAIDVREREQASSDVVVIDNPGLDAYDRVILPAPPDRALLRHWLLVGWHALAPGGVLVLAGANAEGGKSAIADARAIFGGVQDTFRQKHRIARAVKPAKIPHWPAWASEDGIQPGSWQSFEVAIGNELLPLQTQAGVFAGGRLDTGTRLLLQHLDVQPGSRVLDVGSGAGVIGITASRLGAADVTLVDANLLAFEASERNLHTLDIRGRALASDVYSAIPSETFDLIVSNPPFHRGKQIDYTVADTLIRGAPNHLRPNGRLLIVANAFLAYGKQLERVFRNVNIVSSTRSFHVLSSTAPR